MLLTSKSIITVLIMAISVLTFGQQETIELSKKQVSELVENEEKIKKWIEELHNPGVKVNENQMKFNKEALKLINDEGYRDQVYKNKYSFLDVKESLTKMEIQKAFWQMINLYPKNKETVLKYIFAYDKHLDVDKVVVSAFYTYAFFDPKITIIENGKPNVHRPDIFEEHFRYTKEIVTYMAYFRKETNK